jgi:rhomboid protease GluP
MPPASRLCPYCRELNGVGEVRCYRCGRRLPGQGMSSVLDVWRTLLGADFPVTKMYVVLCLGVFVFSTLTKGKLSLFGGMPLSEAIRWGALWNVLGRYEPWRYLSAMFVHFGILHIVFNMMALFDFGRITEREIGSSRFTIVFVMTGVVGFLVSDVWYSLQGMAPPTAGASGGLFGLVGTVIGYLFARKNPAYKQYLTHAALFTLVMLIAGFPVNHAAHLGGLALGALFGFAFSKETRPWKRTWLFGIAAAALIVASFASIVLSHVSPVWKEIRQEEERSGMGA